LDVVLYVFRHIFDTDFEENVIRKLAALLSEIEDYREFSEFWNWAFRYACEARHGDKEKLVAAITGATENIRDERVKMAAMTIAEQFRQEGRNEGRNEGINEGRNEGIKIGMEEGMLIGMEEGEKKTLFRLLKKRFGNISPIIEEKLKFSKKDILDRFTDSIFDFRDLSDAEKWWELNDTQIRPQRSGVSRMGYGDGRA
jgi:hypothetical protein